MMEFLFITCVGTSATCYKTLSTKTYISNTQRVRFKHKTLCLHSSHDSIERMPQ
jgi:hypothetical protein